MERRTFSKLLGGLAIAPFLPSVAIDRLIKLAEPPVVVQSVVPELADWFTYSLHVFGGEKLGTAVLLNNGKPLRFSTIHPGLVTTEDLFNDVFGLPKHNGQLSIISDTDVIVLVDSVREPLRGGEIIEEPKEGGFHSLSDLINAVRPPIRTRQDILCVNGNSKMLVDFLSGLSK
jgi:hypothetical protein